MAAPDLVAAGTNNAEVVPIFSAKLLLNAFITSLVNLESPVLTACLITADSGVRFFPFFNPSVKILGAVLIVWPTTPLRTALVAAKEPALTATYAAPPAPAKGAVNAANTAVAEMSTTIGAILSKISWGYP